VERLEAALSAWTAAIPNDWAKSVSYLLFSCLLHQAKPIGLWRISYRRLMIQNFLVDAETIWNHPVERWVTRARDNRAASGNFAQRFGAGF